MPPMGGFTHTLQKKASSWLSKAERDQEQPDPYTAAGDSCAVLAAKSHDATFFSKLPQ